VWALCAVPINSMNQQLLLRIAVYLQVWLPIQTAMKYKAAVCELGLKPVVLSGWMLGDLES
jgi:hypothetical protein